MSLHKSTSMVIQKHEKNEYFIWHHTAVEEGREVPCPLFLHYVSNVPVLNRKCSSVRYRDE